MKGRIRWFWSLEWDGKGFVLTVQSWRGMTKKAHDAARVTTGEQR